MSKEKYFVMIHAGYALDWPRPLVDQYDETLLFDTDAEATTAARTNTLAGTYGFEVYPWPYGGDGQR